jgi:hypothetical protein
MVMHHRAAILSLFASACVGTLTGEGPEPLPPPEPPPEPITDVTVRAGANAQVIFQGPDDALIADLTTDATGHATAKMPSGGSVTVIRAGETAQLFTYLAVKPGDLLGLAGPPLNPTPLVAQVTVALPAGTPVSVTAPCGKGAGVAPTIDVTLNCGAEVDFYVVDQATGDAFTVRSKVSPVIDFSDEIFRGPLSSELRASNMMTAAQVALQKRLQMGRLVVFDSGAIAAPVATVNAPELPNTQQLVSAYVTYEGRTFVITSRDAFAPTPSTVDISARAIPASTAPMFAGNTLWWSEVGSGTAALSVAHVSIPERNFTRHFAGPYLGTSLRLPPLPAPHDHFNIAPTDVPKVIHNLANLDGGYDAVRARVFDQALADIAPMGGTAVASVYATN